MRSHSYINTVKTILGSYDGSIPLAAWLKQFFKADKKYGSRDRKQIAHLCYCYFRLGNSFRQTLLEERLLISLFLCSTASNYILEEIRPEWNNRIHLGLDEKLEWLDATTELNEIFPFPAELSSEIDQASFNLSFLVQPDLHLRIRPGKKEPVLKQLEGARIEYRIDGDCLILPNGTKIEELLQPDEEVVVQDLNSQKVMDPLSGISFHKTLDVWDCCAASGGKSILLYDLHPSIRLTVSDVRESILINLRNRFRRAGINNYTSFVADISAPDFSLQKKFDLVICDAPCSGSGTWSRTPEQLQFFTAEKIEHYARLQKSITANAATCVKKQGWLLYITCSVFRKENEEVVKFLEENTSLVLKSMQYFKGYDKKADSLFVSVFSVL